MGLKLSTGFRNTWLAGTSSFQEIFASCIVRVYDGDMPESADAAVTGNHICTMSAMSFGTTGTSGTVGKDSTYVSGITAAAGTAGYFRMSEASDNPAVISTTARRIDGLIGTTDTYDADYILVDNALTANRSLDINLATFGLPE